MGPCYHLGGNCILLALRETPPHPLLLFTPPTPMQHTLLLLRSCKSDEGHASFCQQCRQKGRLAFIHNGEVGGGGTVREGEEECQEGDVMLASNDYVGKRASLTTPEGR